MKETIYTDTIGHDHTAVFLGWIEVEQILGHPHRGSADDDKQLVEYLIENGAPSWGASAEGWIDELGWGLIGPEINE